MKLAAAIVGAGVLWIAAASWLFLALAQFNSPVPYTPWLVLEYLPYVGLASVGVLMAVSFGVPAVIGGAIAYRVRGMLVGVTLYGKARFATRMDAWRAGLRLSLRPKPGTLILGKLGMAYVGLPGCEHVMVYARTGAGKGVSYVIPNCLHYADSLVVLDVKAENFAATAGHRAWTMGQDVFLFAPLAEDGLSHRWNPFSGIDANRPDYVSRLQRIAYDFFPEVIGREKFWQDGARAAFLGIAVLLAESGEAPLTPGNVFRFFTAGDANDRMAGIIAARRASGPPLSQLCVDLISDYLAGTTEVAGGIRKHVSSTMGLWFNPRVVAATDASDFDLADLRRRRMTVYVAVQPAQIGQLGHLLRLFFNALFEANTDVLPEQDATICHRCHVLLDEFTALPTMTAFAKAAGFARGFGLHFSYVVQSKKQIIEAYRDNGQSSLLDNVGAQVMFGTDDPELTREASERAGFDTVDATTTNAPRYMSWFRTKQHTEATHEHRRALLLPQEVARLNPAYALLYRGPMFVMKLRRIEWFRDSVFARRVRPVPFVPTLVYRMARDDGRVQIKA